MSFKPFSGTGTLFMAPVDSDGALTGKFVEVGDAYPFSLQVTTKQTEVKSRQVERAGQIIASRTAIDSIKGTLTLREWNAANLAAGLSGAYEAMTAAGDDVVAESITMGKPGEWTQLGGSTPRGNISAVTVTSSPAGTTYDVDDDYVFNAKLGLITSVAGGDLAAGTVTVLVSYTYAAETNYKVSIGSQVQIRKAIRGLIQDEFRDVYYRVNFDSVKMSASQEINFISEEDSTGEPITFELTFETLSGKSTPGTVEEVPF